MTTIKEIRTTPVAIKDPPLLNLWGVHEPYALRSRVEVELSDGTVGLGETYAGSILLETMRATLADLVGMQAENRLQVTTCARQNAAAYLGDRKGANRKSREVASVIDMALLDAVGKSHGLRACDLLGGAHRGEVAFCGYLFYRFEHHIDAPYEADTWGAATTHEGVVAQALRMRELHGYASYKLKGGVYDAAFEMETLRHLKRAMPTLPLRYDPNCGWDVATTREHLKAAGELLEYLEDPVRGIPDMAALERESTIPFSTNMCVTDFEDLLPAHQQGGPTVILADPHFGVGRPEQWPWELHVGLSASVPPCIQTRTLESA
jgi:glucarate dehydratase